jgi:hypothetical protein
VPVRLDLVGEVLSKEVEAFRGDLRSGRVLGALDESLSGTDARSATALATGEPDNRYVGEPPCGRCHSLNWHIFI